MHRAELLLSAVACLVAHAAAQETPAQNLVRLWLDDPRPEIEARVVELGAEAVAPLLAQLGIKEGQDEGEERKRDAKGKGKPFLVEAFGPSEKEAKARHDNDLGRRRLALAALARLGAPAQKAFAPLARAAAAADPETKIPYYAALAQLAAWRQADDRLWPEYYDHPARELVGGKPRAAAWPAELVCTAQRTASRCWGRPRTGREEFASLLDSCNPWRVELALEELTRDASAHRESMQALLPRLLELSQRPDPRILFTTRRVPLRAKAARLALALAKGSTDERALRGVLLGEPPTIATPAVPDAVAARVRERLTEVADAAKRPEALAALAAFGPAAFPAIAAELDAHHDPEVGAELLRILRTAAPQATEVLPVLLDALSEIPTALQSDLLQTVIAIAPWSRDRVQWCHLGARSVYFVEDQILPVPSAVESTESLRLLNLASDADGHCTFDELRDLLSSPDHLVRHLGIHLAIVRPNDLRLLQKELVACLEAERDPKFGNPFAFRHDAEVFETHRLGIARLLLPTAAPGSDLEVLAKKIVDGATTKATAPREPTVVDRAPEEATPPDRADDAAPPAATPSRGLRDLVEQLDSDQRGKAEQALLRGGAEAVRALVDGLGDDEPVARTIARLHLLERMPILAAAKFFRIQEAAQAKPLRCPVEFLRTIAEVAPFRDPRIVLLRDLPRRVGPDSGFADVPATNRALALVATRLAARNAVGTTAEFSDVLLRLRSPRAYVVEAAIDRIAATPAEARAAIPLLHEVVRGDDPCVLRTDDTVPLRAKAAAAILAIDESVSFAAELRSLAPRPHRATRTPERLRTRALEVMRDLEAPQLRAAARETLVQLGPLCGTAVAEFVASTEASFAARIEAVDTLLAISHDTTASTVALVDRLAEATAANRLAELVALCYLAPWCRHVLPQVHGNGVNELFLHDVDLIRNGDPRTRSALRIVADDLRRVQTFDPLAPAPDLVELLRSESFFERLHALHAIALRPGAFTGYLEPLVLAMETPGVFTRFGPWLGEPALQGLVRSIRRAAAEAVLSQAAADSPQADKARALLETMRSATPK